MGTPALVIILATTAVAIVSKAAHIIETSSGYTGVDVRDNGRILGGGRTLWQKRDDVSDGEDGSAEEVKVINRCRAQELSPGGALGIMIVLATGSAIHMPGSFILPKRRGFYRFAPELRIFESLAILLMVPKGLSSIGRA
jgi:hypothetical protein